MRLRTEDRSVETFKAQPLRETLERLRVTLDHDSRSWAEFLRMTERDYEKVKSGRKSIDVLQLADLAERLHVSMDAFQSGEIDFRAVAAQCAGEKDYVPERYSLAAFSKRRTSINILDYLEDAAGWQTRLAVLRRFQVDDAVFSDPEAAINIRFVTDMLHFLRQRGYGYDDFFAMGAYSVVSNQMSGLGKIYSQFRSPCEIYEYVFSASRGHAHYDRNHDYRLIELSDDHCVVESRTSEEVGTGLGVKNVGSQDTCMTRMGTFASAPGYLGLPFAAVHESTCIHRGDSCCTLNVDFSHAAHRAKSLRMSS